MQYLDNDIDDLFNKAGNDYPLRTDVPDFDGVLGKLNPTAGAAPRQSYRKYLLLLLLLPVGYLLNNNNNDLNKKATINPSVINPLSEIPTSPLSKEGEQAPQIINEKNTTLINPEEARNNKNTVKNNELITASSFYNSVIRSSFEKRDNAGFSEMENPSNNSSFQLAKPSYSYPKPLITFPKLPIDSAISGPVKKEKQKSSFYVGIIAGPDISTVKYQSIKNAGFSVGIAGGYTFSKRWSVETGLIYTSKKYYTDGKYFDKTKSGIPSSVYVESLDGSCNMFEVPVSVRYDFSTNRNRFFATLGATSYFMKKEKYTYDAYASGSYYEGHRSYNNSGNYFFSNMHLSVGYNRQLSNKINLRIEPYIKVPIRDIGIGSLPITSSGIYFSVMQSIR